MLQRFETTSLWQRTLAAQTGDGNGEAREILRRGYLDMRSSVAVLVSQIKIDCPELTVHDITHLDALWETADTIIGPAYEVNPAEAFVFGAAVLLHDAATTLAAYQNGVSDLNQLSEWRDAVAEWAGAYIEDHPEDILLNQASPSVRGNVIFDVLRRLHASQAENLLNLKFNRPNQKETIELLQNTELKSAFGYSIGRIAHSHHWDIRDIPTYLETKVGTATIMPTEWSVNEVKVACMLRCADAAHLDARRAPTFLYALTKPKESSDLHWNFQNKLNQIARSGNKIVFTSGSAFSSKDANAWWLAYENAQMVDREIRNSNATLEEAGEQSFLVTGVLAVESPAMFAKKVRVAGWEPVDAQVRVSDPVHLARTIGGENLNGKRQIGTFA